jgi:hypothetical protein
MEKEKASAKTSGEHAEKTNTKQPTDNAAKKKNRKVCSYVAMWDAKSTVDIVLMMDLQTVVQFAHTSSHIRSVIAGSFTHIMCELTPIGAPYYEERFFGDEHLKLLQVVCADKSPTDSVALVTELFATKNKFESESEITLLHSLMRTSWSLVDCARVFASKDVGFFESPLPRMNAISEWRNTISSLCKQRGWAEHDLIFGMYQAHWTKCTSGPGKPPDLAAGFYNLFGPFENYFDEPYVIQDWALRQRCAAKKNGGECYGKRCACDFDVVKFAQEVKKFFVHIVQEAEQCQFMLSLTKDWKLTARLVLFALTCEHWAVGQRLRLKEAIGSTFDFRIIKELTGVEPRMHRESVPRCDAQTIVKVVKFTQAMWIGVAEEETAAQREEEEIAENQREFEADEQAAKQAFEAKWRVRVAQQKQKQNALRAANSGGGAALRHCLMDIEEGETLECDCDVGGLYCDEWILRGGCYCRVADRRNVQQKIQLRVLTHFKFDNPWDTELPYI